MYDDAWYNALIPSAQAADEKGYNSKHRRRESLLKQPNEKTQHDSSQKDGAPSILEEDASIMQGPPTATIVQRAKSYSDLDEAASHHLGDIEPDEGYTSHVGKEVKTELDFRKWYESIEGDIIEASHDEFHLYREQLRLSESHLDTLLDDTSSTLALLGSLSESFRLVASQTTAFQKQCQGLVSEQQRVLKLADDVKDNLQYYNYLEPITRRLNAPGAGNFVRGKVFSDMLSTLDECLKYMEAHPGQREAGTYRSRYRLLLTRGLTLIRVHFVNSLREIASDVSKRIADRQLNDTTMSTLLYAKFRVGAAELKSIAQEIRKRAAHTAGADVGGESEYQSLMNELYQNYSTTRGKLVIPLARKKIADISIAPSTSKDLVSFARTSIGYTRGVCIDEYELWGEWFEGDEGLYDFLEFVCEPLYDHLKPRIIRENQLLKLCELCTLIQSRYMRDQDDDADQAESHQLDFSTLILPALEDTQTRLVFRAQAILRDDIENYRPTADDLDHPRRKRGSSVAEKPTGGPILSGRKAKTAAFPGTPTPKTPVVVDEDLSDVNGEREARWDLATEAVSHDWYPTLKKAIWLLSRIYRLVNSSVFDDLAHQIVHQTTNSLHQAATRVAAKSSEVDGQLFLIKHLLILKSQIVAFDIEFVTPEVSFDFSNVTNTFWELRERGGLFNPLNIMRFVGGGLMPRVVENMLDAKADLDARLRSVIGEYTAKASKKMSAAVSGKEVEKASFDARAAVRTVQEVTTKELPILRKKLDEHLEDSRTNETLVAAVQDQLLRDYETFYEKLTAKANANGKAIAKKGKGREDQVWDVDTFAEWTDSVFKKERDPTVISDDDEGNGDRDPEGSDGNLSS
ncbi:MAG: hypothetical protein M1825_004917 [Sarcosagium campestre]|nr:MAG: hypothetical protein M1825_004917 [Sarcosagium campestre]